MATIEVYDGFPTWSFASPLLTEFVLATEHPFGEMADEYEDFWPHTAPVSGRC